MSVYQNGAAICDERIRLLQAGLLLPACNVEPPRKCDSVADAIAVEEELCAAWLRGVA